MAKSFSSSSSSYDGPTCSICMEVVVDNRGRSTARLQCGHEFHLDCIGSAFNYKDAMQCPNCRVIEDGEWLYAAGAYDSDDDDVGLLDTMHLLGCPLCPYNGFQGAPPALGQGITVHTTNAITEDLLNIVGGASNPFVNRSHGSIQSWIAQARTLNAANQAHYSPRMMGAAGVLPYCHAIPGSSPQPAIPDQWYAVAPNWSSGETSPWIPYPGNHIIPNQGSQFNWPSPAVASMLNRRRASYHPGSMNPTWAAPASIEQQQSGGFTLFSNQNPISNSPLPAAAAAMYSQRRVSDNPGQSGSFTLFPNQNPVLNSPSPAVAAMYGQRRVSDNPGLTSPMSPMSPMSPTPLQQTGGYTLFPSPSEHSNTNNAPNEVALPRESRTRPRGDTQQQRPPESMAPANGPNDESDDDRQRKTYRFF